MSTVEPIIQRCQELFDDLSFNYAREWKNADPQRKVVAFMPIYVPRELIHAANMLPLGVLGGGDQLEVIQGDAYYQSYICRIPRSTIELILTKRLDFIRVQSRRIRCVGSPSLDGRHRRPPCRPDTARGFSSYSQSQKPSYC